MIKKITLKNFRNFSCEEFFFSDKQNAIIWENWKWKTNILEALALFSWINFSKIDFDNLVKIWEEIFYIEIELSSSEKIAISYDKGIKKKKYIINWKNTTLQKIKDLTDKIVLFSPIIMNMMYLSPSLRRDFLDEILFKTFNDYKKIYNDYKKILISRNRVLKNIREKKSEKYELDFWDNKFINLSTIIYNYRFWLATFLEENTKDFTKYFNNKINIFEFKYKSKINFDKKLNKKQNIENIKNQIIEKLEENIEKDIILATTNVWPHIDDFEININNVLLTEFASRWEVKSVIIWLKLLEIKFIENFTNKKPILLIDDLLSELDNNHKNLLLSNIKNYQTFITSIREDYKNIENIIKL